MGFYLEFYSRLKLDIETIHKEKSEFWHSLHSNTQEIDGEKCHKRIMYTHGGQTNLPLSVRTYIMNGRMNPLRTFGPPCTSNI